MPVSNVCLMGPAAFFGDAAPAFAASHPSLTVSRIDYAEPAPLRRARALGPLPPALAALEPPLDDAACHALAAAEAVIALDLPTAVLTLAPKLRYVQSFGAGIEWLVPFDFGSRGIAFADASGVSSDSIAEFVMARLLEVWKDLRAIEAQQVGREWRPRWAGQVAGRTMGIVSLGAIGRACAARARAFGMVTLATRRSASPADVDADVDGLYGLDAMDAMLSRCDAVVLAAPATAETDDLFDAARFAAMKPGAIFVNVSRGSLVDEAALLTALRSGHLGAAVIDVVKDEPAPPDHPFWDAPRMYLSPHCSASFDGYVDRLLDLFADNLTRLAEGLPLRNAVDPKLGY